MISREKCGVRVGFFSLINWFFVQIRCVFVWFRWWDRRMHHMRICIIEFDRYYCNYSVILIILCIFVVWNAISGVGLPAMHILEQRLLHWFSCGGVFFCLNIGFYDSQVFIIFNMGSWPFGRGGDKNKFRISKNM